MDYEEVKRERKELGKKLIDHFNRELIEDKNNRGALSGWWIDHTIKDLAKYETKIQNYTFEELMWELQGEISSQVPAFTRYQAGKGVYLLAEYLKRGGDPEYFTNGAGAPGNCAVM